MKKVKYAGDGEVLLPTLNLVVKSGDVIEVDDNFENALFEVVNEKGSKSKEGKE